VQPVKIFFDTEFIEDGHTIDLVSLGAVREDGEQFYAVNRGFNRSKLFENPWLVENVLPYLPIGKVCWDEPWSYENSEDLLSLDWLTRTQIRERFLEFAGPAPEFWAWFSAYDWVALCQVFGKMIDLPPHWPMFCHDLRQLAEERPVTLMPDNEHNHHALSDAHFAKKLYEVLA
jgi:hypothetical protein